VRVFDSLRVCVRLRASWRVCREFIRDVRTTRARAGRGVRASCARGCARARAPA